MVTETVDALDSRTLKRLLVQLDMLESFERGDAQCAVCSRQVGYDDVMSVYMETGRQLRFVCDEYACLNKLQQARQGGSV